MCLSRCREAADLDRENLVELQRDINELSLTGKIVSRTRKSEVIPDRAVRSPNVVRFHFSTVERAFYDSVAELCQVVHPEVSGWGQAMAVLQAYRATVELHTCSCHIVSGKSSETSRAIIEGLVSEFDEDQESDKRDANAWRMERSTLVQDKLDDISTALGVLTDEDTKYAHLKRTLRSICREDDSTGGPPRKVVLFAFGMRALGYLRERLIADADYMPHVSA